MQLYIVYARQFSHCVQFNLDEACSSLVRSIDHYVSQQNTYSISAIHYNNYIDKNRGRKLPQNFLYCKLF